MLRKLPVAAYLLALICFLLPFVEVSCNSQKVVSLTGLQLLAGTQVGSGGVFGAPAQQIKPETSVIVAFAGGIAGLVLSLMKQRRTDFAAGACGIVAAGSLLALQQSIASGASPQAMAVIQVQYQAGYFLSVATLFVGAAAAFYVAVSRRPVPAPAQPLAATISPPAYRPAVQANAASIRAAASPTLAGSSPPPRPATSIRFCPQCGEHLNGSARFCGKCGATQA